MRRAVVAFLCLISLTFVSGSQGQTEWQSIYPSARAFGMGQSGVVEIYNLSALYWNPAALSFIHAHQGSFTLMPPFQLNAFGYAGFVPFRGTFAFHIAPINNGDAKQVTSVGWGRNIGASAHIGMAANFLQFEDKNTTALGFGFLFRPVSSVSFASRVPFGIHSLFADRFTLGLALQGLSVGSVDLDSQLQIGASYALFPNWPKVVYAFHGGSVHNSHHLGFLFKPASTIEFYTGWTDWQSEKAAAGVTWQWQNIDIDLAYRFKDKVFKITTSFDIGPPARELSARAYANAYAYLQDNRLSKAYEYCKRSLDYDPQNIQAADILSNLTPQLQEQNRLIDSLMTAARQYIEKRWYISAATNYLNILHLDPDNTKAQKALETIGPFVTEHTDKWYELGQQYFEKGDLEMAKEVIENILRVRPENLDAEQFLEQINDGLQKQAQEYFYAGLGFYQQKKYDQAEAQFTQALIISPDFTEASHYLNLINSERAHIEEMIEKHIGEGERLQRNKDWSGALDRYQQVLELDPDHTAAKSKIEETLDQRNVHLDQLFSRADASRKRGDRNIAKRLLREIIEIRPSYPGARSMLDQLLTSREKAQRYIELAKQYSEQYRWESAVVALDSAQTYYPTSSEAKRMRRKVYENLNSDRLMRIGRTAYRQGRFRDVIDVADAILKKEPRHQAARELQQQCQARIDRLVDEYFNQGIQLFTEEKYREAIAEWQKALRLNPSHRGSLEYKKRAEERLRALSGLQ
ncbi:tetratricopeptide repeat protein [candidate division KSB1 bacterium]|nr:tetratricopeptide repeat protein [candidate division KSB1 bacterium]